MKNFISEFKEFAVKGSVIDLAIGIIIGTAFNRIVTSLVNDVLTPPLGLLLNKVDFTNLYWNLGAGTYETLAEAQKAGAPTLNYGIFINSIISFALTAFAVFILVRYINRMKRRNEAIPGPTRKKCLYCDTEISLVAKRCPNCTSEL
ncbi:MAG: mechanosensitive ion channel protein MscL [Candidatus Taylorbacteria bacterium RIFCSPLOWO2_01_FULL_45_15b]|uniref:Large-conductance mechanosensitive channel n=1 Tax=Candidatus Taylorbacteria bacterium RIFCSPLOWO2_01_FULL_45_15b TaxID=1802319 RepID=A0A1G2NBY0_9BACT|nr:MAG: mechanosensitive ion channel protein MscL [Candidatus Taylorbacteria bacterium RIFCSPLOWO2_01_FULL_45_15b]